MKTETINEEFYDYIEKCSEDSMELRRVKKIIKLQSELIELYDTSLKAFGFDIENYNSVVKRKEEIEKLWERKDNY